MFPQGILGTITESVCVCARTRLLGAGVALVIHCWELPEYSDAQGKLASQFEQFSILNKACSVVHEVL